MLFLKPNRLILLALLGVLCSGCADSPVTELAAFNPWERHQWAQDERFGPTMHQHVAELASLRTQAPQMSEAERHREAVRLSQWLGQDVPSTLRQELVKTLGTLRTPGAAPALRVAVNDGDADVRVAACQAWGTMGGPEAVPMLAQVLGSDTDLDVRLAATRELARFNEPAAVQALGLALDDSDPAMQYRAVQSLKSATGRNYGNDVPAWREFVRGGNPPPYQPTLAERFRSLF